MSAAPDQSISHRSDVLTAVETASAVMRMLVPCDENGKVL